MEAALSKFIALAKKGHVTITAPIATPPSTGPAADANQTETKAHGRTSQGAPPRTNALAKASVAFALAACGLLPATTMAQQQGQGAQASNPEIDKAPTHLSLPARQSLAPVTVTLNGVTQQYLTGERAVQISKDVAHQLKLKTGWEGLYGVIQSEFSWSLDAMQKWYPEHSGHLDQAAVQRMVLDAGQDLKLAEEWAKAKMGADYSSMGLAKYIASYYKSDSKSAANNAKSGNLSEEGNRLYSAISLGGNAISRGAADISHIRSKLGGDVIPEGEMDDGGGFFNLGKYDGVDVVYSQIDNVTAYNTKTKQVFVSKETVDDVSKIIGPKSRELTIQGLLYHEVGHAKTIAKADSSDLNNDSWRRHSENAADAYASICLLKSGFHPKEILSFHVAMDAIDRVDVQNIYFVTTAYSKNNDAIIEILAQDVAPEKIYQEMKAFMSSSVGWMNGDANGYNGEACASLPVPGG